MKLFMEANLICIESKFERSHAEFVIKNKELTTTKILQFYAEYSLPNLLSKL